ncbi:hypothetical protein [Streptacidiphilus sp. EB103A]|uniref:hypothetical protein n=1 Tax=Streptacidiphilus sp. EB103A TaxID=3156275 RepID=UPI003517B1CF
MTPRLKKRLTALAAALSLCTGIGIAASPSAGAAVKGEFNLGVESGSPLVGHLLPRICDNGFSDESVWFINNETGQIYDHSMDGQWPVYTNVGGNRYLSPHWFRMTGHCFYPVSSSWALWGGARRISNYATNCTRGTENLSVQESYSTSSSTTKTVGTSVSVGGEMPWIPLKIEASVDLSRSWSYGKDHTWGQTINIGVAPGRTAWVDARALKRQVRINPHFWVDSYEWNWDQTAGGSVVTHGWAGNPSYTSIVDHGYYYDAKSEIIGSDGNPIFNFVARDTPASVC